MEHMSIIRGPRKEIDYCPHDTPWQQIADVESLRKQCLRRGLSDDGNMSSLQQRLEEYQQAHRHENEARAATWRVVPDLAWVNASCTWRDYDFQLIQLTDTSDVGSWWLEKQFTLNVRNSGIFTVVISKDLTCNCHTVSTTPSFESLPGAKTNSLPTSQPIEGNQGTMCEHIVYVLEYILRCPEPLVFQNAFLSVELEYIFAANPYFYYFPNKTPERVPQDDVVPSPACVICFQKISYTPILPCAKCGDSAHRECFDIFNDIRKPSQRLRCVLCEDEKEWACPERESAPPSQNLLHEEDGNNPLHEIKLVAMLYYEEKSRRHT